jgi:tetratricopeptide (TPR) repeat protein
MWSRRPDVSRRSAEAIRRPHDPGRRSRLTRVPLRGLPLAMALVLLVLLVLPPAPATAQRSLFIDHLISVHMALSGHYGDEGPAIERHLAGMAAALEAWDKHLAWLETDLRGQLPIASPAGALRIRTVLASEYIGRARFDDALGEIAAAIELAPDDAELHLLRGMVHEAMDRPQETVQSFRRAWTLDPDHPVKAYLLASRLRAQDDHADIQPLIAVLLAALPRGDGTDAALPDPFQEMALVRDEASAIPVFAPARYAAGFQAIAARRYGDAIARFTVAAADDPLLVDPAAQTPRMAQGILALRAGRVELAQGHLEAAARAMPDSSEAHRILGMVRAARGHYASAVESLDTAVRLAPGDERARVALGRALSDAGDWERAEAVLVETTEAMPEAAEARWELADMYERLERPADAVAALQEAAASVVLVGKGELYDRLARLSRQQDDIEQAVTALRHRVKRNPNLAAAHRDLGRVYLEHPWRPEEALLELAMTLLLEPDDPRAHGSMGQVHLVEGRYAEAEPLLRRAIALGLDTGYLRHSLAQTLLGLGRTAEAEEHLAEFSRRRTEDFEALRQAFEERRRNLLGSDTTGQ